MWESNFHGFCLAIHEALHAWCLRYNICSTWVLDISISTCYVDKPCKYIKVETGLKILTWMTNWPIDMDPCWSKWFIRYSSTQTWHSFLITRVCLPILFKSRTNDCVFFASNSRIWLVIGGNRVSIRASLRVSQRKYKNKTR